MKRLWAWCLEKIRGQYYELWITYQSEAFEEKETHKFIVKKKIKFGPKHIIFKDKDDRIVEIKTQTPIDYMLREYNE
tara:strand:- start:524 stop:754 length:231 start_codon:yes stop_codon:yes gene_type:complete